MRRGSSLGSRRSVIIPSGRRRGARGPKPLHRLRRTGHPMTEPVRLAYLLLIHKNPNQANRLIGQLLKDSQADIFIHIDKKSHPKMAPVLLKDPRVVVLGDPVEVTWGDI